MVVLAGLFLASCGEIEPPYLGAEITVESTVPTDSAAGAEAAVSEDVPAAVQPQSVLPPRDPGYVPVVVLGATDGILSGDVATLGRLAAPLGTLGTTRLSDDLFGGLVVESVDGGVLWFPAEGAEADVLRESGSRLLDVGYLDNTSEALVLTEGVIERIRLVDLEAQPVATVPESDQILDFSAAGGLYAIAYGDEQCGRIAFLNSAGAPVNISGPVVSECPVQRRATHTLLDLSPDGDALAYTEVSYRPDGVEAETVLVGRELTSSAELFRLPIGTAGDRISSLSFDGRRVVFVRTPLEGGQNTVVIVEAVALDPLEEVAVPRAAAPLSVTFARLPLKVGSEVSG